MMEILTPYLGIALKLVTSMIGILVFLRLAGKAQMAQITPLDTVSAFVIGALVGGVLYNPDMSIWHILFALAVWTGFNMLVRFAMRSARLRHFIKERACFSSKMGLSISKTSSAIAWRWNNFVCSSDRKASSRCLMWKMCSSKPMVQ